MTSDRCVYMACLFITLSFGLCSSHNNGLKDNSGYHVDIPMDTDELISVGYTGMPKDSAPADRTHVELNGYGIGTGIGYGSGDGVGSGYGQGSGFGQGSGSGYGEGSGYGSGSGQGCIPGYNCPVASTTPCPHCGYPINMPQPVQACGQWVGHSMGEKTSHMNSAGEQAEAPIVRA